MLRVFSNQLRRIHKMVQAALGQGENVSPALELFKIGEYYYKTGVYQQALFAYKKYMEHYPDTEYASMAMKRIREIETGDMSPQEGFTFTEAEPAHAAGEDMSDFTIETEHEDMDEMSFASSSSEEGISGEMDDFLSNGDDLADLDDFSFDDLSGGGEKSVKEKFDDAASLYENRQFGEALHNYEEILASGELKDDEDISRAYLEIGRCNLKMGQQKEAIENFGTVIKKYPSSSCAKKTYFEIGSIFESAKQKDKALAYFKKVTTLAPKDSLTEEADDRIKKLVG